MTIDVAQYRLEKAARLARGEPKGYAAPAVVATVEPQMSDDVVIINHFKALAAQLGAAVQPQGQMGES